MKQRREGVGMVGLPVRVLAVLALIGMAACPCFSQHEHPPAEQRQHMHMDHQMWTTDVGGGWHLMGMGQIYPLVTFGAPFEAESAFHRTRFYPTQLVGMFNLESPGSLFVVRFTPNLEGLTIPDGETTYGAWGEGFIDSRHPHTIIHEAMLSANFWNAGGGMLSVSGGKGFVPYGTDDPMARPVQKFTSNHHLSQLLERFTVNAVYIHNGWNIEGAVFGGDEPEGPYDFSHIRNFPNSWSVRIGRRFGGREGGGIHSPWEITASYARVFEDHGTDHAEGTDMLNIAVRHEQQYPIGRLYALAEASVSRPQDAQDGLIRFSGANTIQPRLGRLGFYSVLGEGQHISGRHQSYFRLEYATRPEYPRRGEPGTDAFFRYDHGASPIGSTEWFIKSIGYNHSLTTFPFIIRPFVEIQHHSIRRERVVDPVAVFGTNSFWAFSAGLRLFFGGDQMRMGTYGVLDPMTDMHRMAMEHEHDMPHRPHHP